MLHTLRHHLSKRRSTFLVLLLLNFFFSAALSLTIYIDSSYLVETIGATFAKTQHPMWSDPDHVVGALYTIGSLFTVLALMGIPYILRTLGNYRTTLIAITTQVLILLGLGTTNSPWLIIPFFVLATVLNSVFYFNFDVFIERYSKEEDTGKIRGLFMTFGSIAWLLPPVFAGYLAEAKGYQMVYLISALLLLPSVFLIFRYLNHFKDLKYEDVSVSAGHDEIMHDRNLYNTLFINFALHFFYAWMIIYAPLHLHAIGLTWQDIGLILTVALSAFIIFPYPAGFVADKYIGEKELLTLGFILMCITTLFIPIFSLETFSVFGIASILFFGRVGASIVETMSETYYFKKVDSDKPQLIGYFRRTRPLAFIVAPILATVLLETNIAEISDLFSILSVIMLLAVIPVYQLKDTK